MAAWLDIYRSIIFAGQLARTVTLNVDIRRGTAEKNRLSRATVEVCPRIQDHIAWLVQELNDLDTDLRGKFRQSPVWREMDDLLRSVIDDN